MDAIEKRIEKFLTSIAHHSEKMLGYPSARNLNYDFLAPLLNYALNNVGDPFVKGSMHVNSCEFEREVLTFWAKLFRAPENNWWGYVTSGGTEGNLYGLYLARECFENGIVYYSQDTHYSVSKNLHFLNMRNIMIRSQKNGEIDYDDLHETLRINRDAPPIIFANIGTTMTEARDDIGKITEIIKDLAIPAHYIHADAALCGAYAAFLKPRPRFDFVDGADSVAISGHKFVGSPIPCGVVIARKDYVNRIARSVAYIGNLDTTISGSRSGFTPLILWYTMKKLGRRGLQARINKSLDVAAYAVERLQAIDVNAWRNKNALTVVMPQIEKSVRQKWQLATANKISHIMLMPYVTRKHVDEFCHDIVKQAAGKKL